MKAKKLASGKYSMTDVSEEEFLMIMDSLARRRDGYRHAPVPTRRFHGDPEPARIRAKLDKTMQEHDDLVVTMHEAYSGINVSK